MAMTAAELKTMRQVWCPLWDRHEWDTCFDHLEVLARMGRTVLLRPSHHMADGTAWPTSPPTWEQR